jgi:hypothetical protein
MSINIGAHQIDGNQAHLFFTNKDKNPAIDKKITELARKLLTDHDIVPEFASDMVKVTKALKDILTTGSTQSKIDDIVNSQLNSNVSGREKLQGILETFIDATPELTSPTKAEDGYEAKWKKRVQNEDAALLTMGKSLGTDLMKTGVKLLEVIALPIIYLGDLAIFIGKTASAAAKGVGTVLTAIGHGGARLLRGANEVTASAKLFFEKLMVSTETGKMMTKDDKKRFDANTSIGGTATVLAAAGKFRRPLGDTLSGSAGLTPAPNLRDAHAQGFGPIRQDSHSSDGIVDSGSHRFPVGSFEDEDGLDAFASRPRIPMSRSHSVDGSVDVDFDELARRGDSANGSVSGGSEVEWGEFQSAQQ